MRPFAVTLSAAEKHDKGKLGSSKIVWEYNTHGMMQTLDIAKTIMNGTYPDSGWTANSKSTMLFYVVEGTVTITFKSGEHFHLEAEDVCYIPPNCYYKIQGRCTALMPCSPAWNPEQSIKEN